MRTGLVGAVPLTRRRSERDMTTTAPHRHALLFQFVAPDCGALISLRASRIGSLKLSCAVPRVTVAPAAGSWKCATALQRINDVRIDAERKSAHHRWKSITACQAARALIDHHFRAALAVHHARCQAKGPNSAGILGELNAPALPPISLPCVNPISRHRQRRKR